jgi:hypothetical protein
MADYAEKEEKIEFEDQEEDSTQEGSEIPKEVRKLRTQAYDKAVSDLVDMIHDKDILLSKFE